MEQKLIRRLLILGVLAIGGILLMQIFWFVRAWDSKDQDFNQRVHIALRLAANQMADFNESILPRQNLIQRRSSNFYAVNINDEIDANVLEHFLIEAFEEANLNTDFEYGVYDCSSDEMVYGSFCDIGEKTTETKAEINLPKFKDLEYYFVVSFPSKQSYILSNMRQTLLFSLISLLAVLFFSYAIFVIIRQKQLSEMQKDFINNMTHEFKTPISSIKLATDALKDTAGDDTRMLKYLGIIGEQNSRLNSQVEKVLNIAKLEGQELKIKKSKKDIISSIYEMVKLTKLRLDVSGGEIQFLHDQDAAVANIDLFHFEQMVQTLIDNAIKYSAGPPQIKLHLTSEKDRIIFSIEDQGIGIEKAYHNRIFDKFFRVPTGNLHDVKGFGLGLYYVKKVCSAHGWNIKLDSVVGKGTTIKITMS